MPQLRTSLRTRHPFSRLLSKTKSDHCVLESASWGRGRFLVKVLLYLVISSQLSKLLDTLLRHQTGWTWQKSKKGQPFSGKSKRIGSTEDQACGHEGLRQKRMVITAVRLSIALIVAGGGNITVLAGKWQESMSMSASEAIGLTYSCTARVLQGQGTNCTPTCTITQRMRCMQCRRALRCKIRHSLLEKKQLKPAL